MGNFDTGFFEYITAASNEKVHSQTIAWIFSENCKIFCPKVKADILYNIVSNNDKENLTFNSDGFEPISVIAEVEDIDILIICKEYFIVIENKVKSSEHSNQLIKYEYITSKTELDIDKLDKINCNKCKKCKSTPRKQCERFDRLSKIKEQFLKELRNKKGFYIFLSLIDEFKKVIYPWDLVKYSKLYSSLKNKFEKLETDCIFKKDYYIINEYLSTLKNLVDIFDDEQNNKMILNHVFINGKSKKLDILFHDYIDKQHNESTIIKYIKKNQLETLFQKKFYNLILKKIKQKSEILFEKIIPLVSESHGTALLDFQFNDLSFKKDDKKFIGILQFQGNNIKLAISVNNSHNTTLAEECKKFMSELDKLEDNIYVTIVKLTNQKNDKNYGFSSIKLNYSENINNKGYWQLEDNPEELVKKYLQYANEFFKKFKVETQN